MPWSEILPQFSLAGTLLTVLLLFFAAVGEPLLGRRAFAWLSHREGDGRALELLYAVTMAIHVLWGALVLVVLLTSPNLYPVDLGLRFPDAWGPVVGGALGGLVALVAFWLLVNGVPTKEQYPILAKLPNPGSKKKDAESQTPRGRKGRGHRGRRAPATPMKLPEPGRRQYLLLPHTRKERALAAGMAVTGGVFGELLYRGLFIVLVASMDIPLWIAAVLSVVLFSVAHLYQGWWGLLSAGFSGALFTILYLGTGSLIVPILVHVALNLRSIVFPPASEAARSEEAYDYYEDDDYDGYDDEYEEGGTGEFDAVDTSWEEPNEADATRAMSTQAPPPGPSQNLPPGPHPGPRPGLPPGPPSGPHRSLPPGPHPGPHPGPPLGSPPGPPQGPASDGYETGPRPAPWDRPSQPPPSSGDFLAPEPGPFPGQGPTRWD